MATDDQVIGPNSQNNGQDASQPVTTPTTIDMTNLQGPNKVVNSSGPTHADTGMQPAEAFLTGPDPFAGVTTVLGSSFLGECFTATDPAVSASTASLLTETLNSRFYEPALLGVDLSVYGTRFFSPVDFATSRPSAAGPPARPLASEPSREAPSIVAVLG